MANTLKRNRGQVLAVVEYRQSNPPWLMLNPRHLNMFSSQYVDNDQDSGFDEEVC